jgi:phenylacetate-CoA ligase
MPLAVFHDRTSLLANIAYGERERAVEAAVIGRRYRYSVLDLRGARGTFVHVQGFYAEAVMRPLRPRRRLVTVDRAPEEALEAIERARPSVIRGHGSHLELIFRVAAGRGGLSHRPAAVFYAGDTLSAEGRRLIEHEFGIPVLSVYGAVECFKIGFTCQERSGFHLHDDLAHVMLVDPDGRRVETGERGEVVLSNLVNRGTVLLNYRLGDLARLSAEPCACGRTSRRLIDLEGRVNEILELADGRFVYPTDVCNLVRDCSGVLRFQLVQHARDRFELRVVTSGTSEADRALADATSALRRVLGGAQIDVVRVPELEDVRGGKYRPVVPLPPRGTSELVRGAG